MPGTKKKGFADNTTIVLMVLFIVCLCWELYWFGKDQHVTFSEVFRRLNYNSGGLPFWGLLAFLLHACVPWPASFHNSEAYFKAWQSSPDLES